MTEEQKARGASAAFRVGDSPDIIRTSTKVLQFYEFWRSRGKGGMLPRKSDMDPVDMGPFLANIVLTEVSYEPLDFKYRIIGEELISRLGNLTGKRVREMALINVSSSAYQNYCAVAETKRAQFSRAMPSRRRRRTVPISCRASIARCRATARPWTSSSLASPSTDHSGAHRARLASLPA